MEKVIVSRIPDIYDMFGLWSFRTRLGIVGMQCICISVFFFFFSLRSMFQCFLVGPEYCS